MPPVLRSALTLRVRFELLTTGVALNAPLRRQDVSVHPGDFIFSPRLDDRQQLQVNGVWSRKAGGDTHNGKTFRRTLFELHSGRQVPELPSKLLLKDLGATQETRYDLVRHATSEDLIAALGPIGLEYAVGQRILRDRLDISYVGDPLLLHRNRSEASKRAREREVEAKKLRKEGVDPIHLKSLLVQYLRHVDPILRYQFRFEHAKFANTKLDDALLRLLNNDNARYLSIGGRDIRDLMTWTWILTSDTTERAATRLLAVAHQNFTNRKGRWSMPLFVYILLLRRRISSAEALRSLLLYAWELMGNSEKLLGPSPQLEKLASGTTVRDESSKKTRIIKNPEDDKVGMDERMFMIMIIRLLRSARRVWPAACNSIVALISRYLDGLNFRKDVSPTTKLTSEDIARLTYVYNTLLKLVSLPASISPYRSAYHQQRAQFILLRRMNTFQPPLVIDRRGYRAVISTQLMHKKTLKEREWAQMKARSWPPWKEEKLGIDADITVEHGVSRAMEVIRQSWEAGYAPKDWDAVASVLSGWDTDRSPTIQTRAVHTPKSPGFSTAKVWVSRIRATRTLDEAWSCFLSYRDQKRTHVGASYVYHQMFAKIGQDAKRPPAKDLNRTSTDYTDEQQPLPGDGVEVLAAPESPREAVYVRIPPPTINEFVEMMAKDKIKLGERLLSSLLENAPTLETGLRYLEASTISDVQVRVLSDRKPPSNPEDQTALESIPCHLFSSFIALLTHSVPDQPGLNKFALVQTGSTLDSVMAKTESAQLDSPQSPADSEQSLGFASQPRSLATNPLLEAIELVLARRPRYRPAWYHLLRALSRRRVVTNMAASRSVDQDHQDIKTWQMSCHLLLEMSDIDLTLDLEGFHILCVGLEKAIFASERLSRRFRNRRGDYVLSAGLPLLKQIFKDTVRSKSMQQDIPSSLVEEKSRITKSVEEQVESESNVIEEDIEAESTMESEAFLPPGCLLPRLLEVPQPACLHSFVRVLGLRRDYDGLLDLVEWMSLFSDEINALADESANGYRMMRRCLTAVRVFMERSWTTLEKTEGEDQEEDPGTVHGELGMEAEPAPAKIVKAVKETVMENLRWGGWPEPHEVEQYCANGKFI